MVKHLNEPPIPPRVRNRDVDAALQPIILKMMAKTPADRYQTPATLMGDLDALHARRVDPGPSRPSKRASGAVVRRRR
jgi:hypothetical protein